MYVSCFQMAFWCQVYRNPTNPTNPPHQHTHTHTAPVVIKCPGCCHLWCFACARPPHFALPCGFAKQWADRTADEDGIMRMLRAAVDGTAVLGRWPFRPTNIIMTQPTTEMKTIELLKRETKLCPVRSVLVFGVKIWCKDSHIWYLYMYLVLFLCIRYV